MCEMCLTFEHKMCQQVDFLPDSPGEILKYSDLLDILFKLQVFVHRLDINLKMFNIRKTAVDVYKSNAQAELTSLKGAFSGFVKLLETNANSVLSEENTDGPDGVNTLVEHSDQIKAGTEGIEAGLAGLEIRAASDTSFYENQNLDEARPMVSSESIALKYDTDLAIKLQSEKEKCQLTGSTVLQNGKFLVVCDSQNRTVKMIDVLLDKIISVVPVASRPWGVAKVTDFHIFVSLIDEQKLLSMYVFNGLIEDESSSISVNGRCCGIACIKQKIIVSYITPPKVEMLDMNGRVLQTIKTDDTGAPLFDKPIHIAISPDGELIYTSDWSKRRVLCIDFSGLVKAKYDNIRCYGITTDLAGTVYVGCIAPNSVHQLYPNCQLHKKVLGEDLLEQTPDSLTYSSEENKLYVAQYDQEFIRRFSYC